MEEMGVGAGLVQALIGYLLTIIVAFGTAGAIWVIVTTLEKMKSRKAAKAAALAGPSVATVSVAATPARDEKAEHAAVIAAAVYATIGAHRLVHIGEPTGPQPGWRTAGRILHQTTRSARNKTG